MKTKRVELNYHQIQRLIQACKTELNEHEVTKAVTPPNHGLARIIQINIEDYQELIEMLTNKL